MAQSRIRRYIRHGTLPQVAVFEASARLGCFTRAAEDLHLAQPTVSTQIRKLSETVGLPLFEQVGKRIQLTEAGRCVQIASGEVFAAFLRLEESLADLRGLEGGRLALAVSPTGQYLAPRLLAGFTRRHPRVELSLQIHDRRTLLERFARNEDDLYIFADPPRESAVTQVILPNPMAVLARSDHDLAQAKRIPLARIAEEPFLMREPGSDTRRLVERLFDRHGLRPAVRMELAANEAIKQAILAGLGISILSRYTLGLDTEQRQLVTLDVEGFPLDCHWYFAYPVGKRLTVAARAFMDFARVEAQGLVAGLSGS